MKNKLKLFLTNKRPRYYIYLYSLRKFFTNLTGFINDFIFNLKKSFIYSTIERSDSTMLTSKDVIKKTFVECYTVLNDIPIIYFTQINEGSYRFIILDNYINQLYLRLLKLLKLNYIIELQIYKKKLIINKRNQKKLKKYLTKFILLKIYKIYYNKNNIQEFGSEISFEIERWFNCGKYFFTHSKNNIQNKMSLDVINNICSIKIYNLKVNQLKELNDYELIQRSIKVSNIDIVYTWVDGNDKKWQVKKDLYVKSFNKNLNETAFSKNRYRNWDELKYSIRSIEKYLTGFRNIYIVTDQQSPKWLKDSTKIKIIDHLELFPNSNDLPVFNSHAIETVLHRIKGLSEHFIYMNDDIFFSKFTDVSFFFPKKWSLYIFPSNSTFIPFEKISKDLLPVDTAAVNTKYLLLNKRIGYPYFKFKHTPLPQIKSLLFKLESNFKIEIINTRKNKFRDPQDISFMSSLVYNYAYLKDIAQIKEIDYSYIDINDKNCIFSLIKIIYSFSYNRNRVFCINDVSGENDKNIKKIKKYMEKFYSDKS